MEFIVNIIQSIIIVSFIVSQLGSRVGINEKVIRVIFTMLFCVYLNIQSYITDFEGYGVFITLLVLGIMIFIFCSGSWLEKLICDVLMISFSVIAAVIAGGIVGLIYNIAYIELTAGDTLIKSVSMLLTQVILFCILCLFKYYIKIFLGVYNKKLNILILLIPIISILIIILLVYRQVIDKTAIIIELIIILNIFIINIIVFIILKYINIQYEELLRKELAFKGFEQQRTDIEAINYKYNWLKKKNHEVKHVMQLMEYYIENNQYEKIKQIINIKDLEKNIRDDEEVYVENPIINYILNRNINICNKNNIDIKCNVMGTVDGIADIDLYILISNLLDNSVEAAKKIKEARISILIYSNERYIYIEIGNSIDNNVMKNNPELKTTKDNKSLHGYGIENIRDIINKYHGEIEYKNQTDTYIVCKVILLKNIETQEN